MKKLYALLLAVVLVFAMNVTAFAAESPNGTPTEDEAGVSSPKTGDLSLITIGLAGGVCAVTSIAAFKKSR